MPGGGRTEPLDPLWFCIGLAVGLPLAIHFLGLWIGLGIGVGVGALFSMIGTRIKKK